MFSIKEKVLKFISLVKELNTFAIYSLVTAFLPMLGSAVLIISIYPVGYWLRENWEIGTILFLAGTWFFCGFSLLPTNVLGILSGWTFGFLLGIAIMITGICGASLVSYFILSRLVGGNLQDFINHHPKAEVLHKSLLKSSLPRTTLIITLLRLSPAMPFAMTNLLMSAARVPIVSFLIGTFFGMIPRSSAVVFFGAGLSELDIKEPFNVWMFAFGVAATIVSIILITYFSRQALSKLTKQEM